MRARSLVLVASTLILLAGLYAASRGVFKPPVRMPGAQTIHLKITDGRLSAGPAVIPAVQGDEITLVALSNRADTLHVHEYEQHLVISLQPGQEMSSTFTVDRAGRFPVHIIGPKGEFVEVAAIEVQPR